MADYYTQFSEVLTHLTAEEEVWLRKQLEFIYIFGDHEYPEGQLPPDLKTADAEWSG